MSTKLGRRFEIVAGIAARHPAATPWLMTRADWMTNADYVLYGAEFWPSNSEWMVPGTYEEDDECDTCSD